MLNTYSTEFFATCPNGGAYILYRLKIETKAMVMVEDIVAWCEATKTGFHEDIADAMHKRFGGSQTLTANHHGVTIETTRTP